MSPEGYASASDEYTEEVYDIAQWTATSDGFEWEPRGDDYLTEDEARRALERKRRSYLHLQPFNHFRLIKVQRTIKITEIPS